MRYAIALVAVVMAVGTPLMAQTDIDQTTLSSRIIPIAPPAPGRFETAMDAMDEEPIGLKYLLSPFFLSTDGAWLASATVGVIRPARLKTSATFTYTYINPDGADDNLDNFGFAVKQEVVKRDRGGVNLLASYADTRDASTKAQFGGAGELIFGGGFTAGLDARWVTTSAAGGIDDIVPKVIGSFEHGKLTFGAEYTLENDVDGESDYAVDVTITTKKGLVVVGAGKNSTVYANFVKVF